jgi:hypothetical protein
VWAFPIGGAPVQLSPLCRPYPDYLPSFPDNVTWVYDSTRDRMIIMPGYFNDFPRALSVCGRSDDRILKRTLPDGRVFKEGGIFNLTSNAWAFPTWPFPAELGYGGDQHSNFGAYDSRSDMVVRFFWDGAWGSNLQRLALATGTWSRFKLGDGTSLERRRVKNTWATTSQPALDVQGRAAYVIAKSNIGIQQPDGTFKDVVEWRLLKVNVDTGAAERIALPPSFVGPNVGDGGTDVSLVFDPVRRVLIHPHFPNLGGDIDGMFVCQVDLGYRWLTVPLPTSAPPLKGNVAGYDTDRGALVLMGGHPVGLPNGTRTATPTHYWTLSLTRG